MATNKHKCNCKDIPHFKSNGPKNSIAPSVKKNLKKQSKKINKESINTSMSKSLFEKLFEEVMQDDNEALGLPSGDSQSSDMGDDSGVSEMDEMGDTVTVTLDKEVAKKLLEVLKSVVGEEEMVGEEEVGEGEGEDFGGESEDAYDDEASEDEDAEHEDEAAEEDKDEDEAAEEDEDEDEHKKLQTEAPQAGYEDFGVEAKSKVLQGKGGQKVQSAASTPAAAKQEGKQTQGTAHYMPAPKYKQKGLTVDSNLKPSKDSAFNR